ncbi:hypothetical protein KCU81_g7191, partial [Aureobasidium melanogenum]|uniref:Zn(2)-C6 fungal-type domain-containing protein n=1 Tax=Aureobasidium melanogenum (strain CBS 110374) TaxID=1043003 RepID=A0A074VDA5_AURM1
MSSDQLTPEQLQLAREQIQLIRDQRSLGMPFLNEDLPFLAEFNSHPFVSVERVVDILEEENSGTTSAAAEDMLAAEHDMGASNTLEISFEEPGAGYGPSTTSTAAGTETVPDMDMFDAPEVGADDPFPNLATATHASTSSSAATPTTTTTTTTAPPDANAFKKSCKICASRKIKCEIIAGSNPRLCKYCQEKGLTCEFELKKSRQQAQS